MNNEDTSTTTPANGFRTFLLLWASQALSVFGTAISYFSMIIWVTQVLYPRPDQQGELGLSLALISLSYSLPVVFGAPLAGAWADRHDRKLTMTATNLANGLISVLVVTLLLAGALQLWLLIGLFFLQSLLSSFHSAAFDTSYSMLVPEAQLPRANGMMQTVWSLSGIICPGLAALLVSLPTLARQGFAPGFLTGLSDGTALAISTDALTFFGVALVLLFLNVPSPKRTDLERDRATGKLKKSMWADIKEGIAYIWHRKPLLWLLATFVVANFAATPLVVLQPLVVKHNLTPDWQSLGLSFEAALALLTTCLSLGGVLGGIFISAWGGLKKRRIYGVLIPILVSGVVQTIYGLSPLLFLTAVMVFVRGATTPIMNSHSQTIWQTQTPRELQGRVFAVRRLIAQFSWPLSTALAGLVSGVFDPGLILSVLAGIVIVFALAQFFNPYLLRVEDKAWVDELASKREIAAGSFSR